MFFFTKSASIISLKKKKLNNGRCAAVQASVQLNRKLLRAAIHERYIHPATSRKYLHIPSQPNLLLISELRFPMPSNPFV